MYLSFGFFDNNMEATDEDVNIPYCILSSLYITGTHRPNLASIILSSWVALSVAWESVVVEITSRCVRRGSFVVGCTANNDDDGGSCVKPFSHVVSSCTTSSPTSCWSMTSSVSSWSTQWSSTESKSSSFLFFTMDTFKQWFLRWAVNDRVVLLFLRHIGQAKPSSFLLMGVKSTKINMLDCGKLPPQNQNTILSP